MVNQISPLEDVHCMDIMTSHSLNPDDLFKFKSRHDNEENEPTYYVVAKSESGSIIFVDLRHPDHWISLDQDWPVWFCGNPGDWGEDWEVTKCDEMTFLDAESYEPSIANESSF